MAVDYARWLVPILGTWPRSLHSSFFGDPAMGQGLSSLFPLFCLLSNLATWVGLAGAVLALACRGRWWPLAITYNGKESEKEYAYTCMCLYFAVHRNKRSNVN